MQRIYRYQHKDASWMRTVSAPGQMKNQVVQPILAGGSRRLLAQNAVGRRRADAKIGDDRAFSACVLNHPSIILWIYHAGFPH